MWFFLRPTFDYISSIFHCFVLELVNYLDVSHLVCIKRGVHTINNVMDVNIRLVLFDFVPKCTNSYFFSLQNYLKMRSSVCGLLG